MHQLAKRRNKTKTNDTFPNTRKSPKLASSWRENEMWADVEHTVGMSFVFGDPGFSNRELCRQGPEELQERNPGDLEKGPDTSCNVT